MTDSKLFFVPQAVTRTTLIRASGKECRKLPFVSQSYDGGFEFQAILIVPSMAFDAKTRRLSIAISTVLITVIVWQAVTGHWEVAAGFGSLMAGLIAVVLMILQ